MVSIKVFVLVLAALVRSTDAFRAAAGPRCCSLVLQADPVDVVATASVVVASIATVGGILAFNQMLIIKPLMDAQTLTLERSLERSLERVSGNFFDWRSFIPF